MANDSPQPLHDPKQALTALRMVWGAMIVTIIGMAAFLFYLVKQGTVETQPETATFLFKTCLGSFFIVTPIAYFFRLQCYKRNWKGNVVTPFGYFVGNIVLFGVCEGWAVLGLVAVHMSGNFGMPELLPSVLALGLLALNFPNGLPMEPRGPELLDR